MPKQNSSGSRGRRRSAREMRRLTECNEMRPCVQLALQQGARDADHWRKMRHAIIFELNRLGVVRDQIKQELLEWNERNFEVLPLREAQGELCRYADWFLKEERKLTCNALKDYCIDTSGSCPFKLRTEPKKLPYTAGDAKQYLISKYKHDGYRMGKILRVLIDLRNEKGKDRLFVTLRAIQTRLLDEENDPCDCMTISRITYRLEKAGFLSVIRGKPWAVGKGQANEYEYCQWTPPDDS